MPTQKAAGITTKIGVDTVDARSSVNQLKRAIQQANRSFRDTANAQRAAGNTTQAMITDSDRLKDRLKAIHNAIVRVKAAMMKARLEGQRGTKNYHQTELDLQRLVTWQNSASYSLKKNSEFMVFHNQKLRESVEATRHNKEVGEELEQQYQAEGNTIDANNQKMENRRSRIQDLTAEINQYSRTIADARSKNDIHDNVNEYHYAVEHKREAIRVRAELRREIALDDSKLKEYEQDEATESERQRSLNQQYQAEHRSVASNNQVVQQRIQKLNQLYRIQKEIDAEMKRATSGPNNYEGTEHVEALKRKLYQLKGAAAQTKSELSDMSKGIPTLSRYNELYDQSVNKVVQRLKSLKQYAEADRQKYIMLQQNIANQKRALDAEKEKLNEVAKANQTASDSTGHLSIAYQREKSRVASLNSTYTLHARKLYNLSHSYGMMSSKSTHAIDDLTSRIRVNDHSAHTWLRNAHAMTNGSIALGAGFYYGAKQATTLEHEFNKVGVLAHNSGESINDVKQNIQVMGNEAVSMSEKYGVSQQKISNGFEELIRRGYSSGQAMKAMPSYLKAATASGEDLGDVINSAGSALEGFGLKNDQIGKNTKVVTNEMAAGADYTASSFHDMAFAMSYVGPVAHQTNQSVSETTSALGELANNGIKGSMAGTSLRKILQNIAGFKPNNKILKSLGLGPKDFQDSKGNLLNISQIMGKIGGKMQNMTGKKKATILQQLFGRTGSQAAAVLTDNADAVAKLDKKVSHATKNGYTSKTSRQNMKTTEGQLLRLKAVGTELSKEYASNLLPAISGVSESVIKLSHALRFMPSGMKTGIALATLAVPAITGVAYAVSMVRKATSVYLMLKRNGLKYFSRSDEELKLNSGYYNKHTADVNTDTSAIKNHNKEMEKLIELTNQANDAVSGNSKVQQTNTDAVEDNATSKRNNNTNTVSSTNTDNENTSVVHSNTVAKQENTEGNENNAKSEDTDTASTDANATSQRTDATATGANTASKEAGVSSPARSESGGSSVAGTVTSDAEKGAEHEAGKGTSLLGKIGKIPFLKSNIAGGVMTGGIDALQGHPKQGLQDGLTTTAGGVLGGLVGGAPGAMIGSMGLPMAVNGIESHLGVGGHKQTSAQRRAVAHANAVHDRNVAHHENQTHMIAMPSKFHYQKGKADRMKQEYGGGKAYDEEIAKSRQRQLARYKRSFGAVLRSLDGTTQKFVRSEAYDEREAEHNYVTHRGKMNKTQKGFYDDMVKKASSYTNTQYNNRVKNDQKMLRQGKITQKMYNEDVSASQKFYSKKRSMLQKDENNVIKASSKGQAARKKALRKFNKDMLTMTRANGKKKTAMSKYFDKHIDSLDQKSTVKTIDGAKKAYNATKKNADKTYNTKKKSADDDYNNTVSHIKSMQGVSSDEKKKAIQKAKDQRDKVVGKAESQKNRTIDKAKDQRDGVVKHAQQQSSWLQKILGNIKGFFHLGKKHKALGTLDTQALHFANGYGYMGNMGGRLTGLPKSENAVVNDGDGKELIRLPNGQLVLPNGRNVHTILPKGTSVFNAGQTRRLLGAVRTPAVHHAGGTDDSVALAGGTAKGKLNSVSVKTPDGSLKKTEKSTKKSMKNIHDILNKGYKKTGKDVQSHLDDLHDNNDDSWDDNRKITKDHVKKIHDDTLDRYSDLKNSINDTEKRSNQLTNSHLGTTVSYFRHHFGMIPPISRSSMRSGVSNINAGITAIDRVLAQFGGNSRVLSGVHYATGTSGPSMLKQLAILNDATSGPTQEAVVSDSGHVRMPRGRNVPMMLNPGDKVLNGSDTLRALKTGLIPHYARGKQSTEALRKLASRYVKQPKAFTHDTFNKFANVIGSALSKDTTVDAKNGAQNPANAWSAAMWHYIDSLINGGSSSGLLNKAEQLGHRAKGYSENTTKRMGPNYYDCASLVWTALKDLGVRVGGGTTVVPIMRAFAGHRVSRADAQPGDLVGSNAHIGLVADKGAHHYYSAQDPSDGIGMEPLVESAFPGGWFHIERVDRLANHDDNYKSPLTGLVKRQLGGRSSKWIQANLSDESGAGGLANPAGDSVSRWRPAVKKALNALHLSNGEGTVQRILRQITTESQGDPNAVGGTDGLNDGHAMGLMQVKPGTFAANAPKGAKWNNGYDSIYAGLKYAMKAYGGLGVLGNGHGYHNGGLSVADKMAHISEGNKPEMVLPLTNKSRAVELMLKSLEYMFGNRQNQNQQRSGQNESNSDSAENLRDRRFEEELIQSNRNKDKMIQNMLNKITVLIKVVQNKPVLSTADIYKANRHETQKKARLRNFNLGTF